MKTILSALLLGILVIIMPFISLAAEYQFQDVTASVVVGTTFKLSVDTESIDFGLLTPGKRVELYPNSHYTEVTCISNNAKTWHLKMQASELKDMKGNIIPVEQFKWQVYSTNGTGVNPKGWQSFKKDTPILVYTSSHNDSFGDDIKIQIKFAIDTPGDAVAGNYSTIVNYSMTEAP